MGLNTMNYENTNNPDSIIKQLLHENERLRWKNKNQKKELRSLNRAVLVTQALNAKFVQHQNYAAATGEAIVEKRSNVS
jgi:hypothetical protein